MVDWQAFSPVFVDINAKDRLFSYCWCLVTRAVVDTEGLHFDADGQREGPATNRDLETLKLTRSYFTDASRWNRRDERSRGISYCPREAASRTLFCALYDATVVAHGEAYLAAPANAAVRDAINRAVPNNNYNHPLTDFNNDAQVDFATMTRMLDDAIRRVREALAARRLTNAEPDADRRTAPASLHSAGARLLLGAG